MKILLLTGWLFVASVAYSQSKIGTPDIINYGKNAYNAGTANWSVAQDSSGLVYFANVEGLLSFDGSYWKTYPLPGGSMGRSVAVGRDHKIYFGGQNEIGYFSPNRNGRLQFTSLVPLLPAAHHPFSDIWNIAVHEDEVLFRSRTAIFRLHNNHITTYAAASEWLFLGYANGQFIAQDAKKGLLTLAGDTWIPLVKANTLLQEGATVTAVSPLGSDTTIVATLKHGLYKLANNRLTIFPSRQMQVFINDRILSCTPVNKDWLVIGTQLNGCYIIDRQGTIIQNFSRRDGLENNCVLALLLDKNQNLWLGLDNGIGFMAYNNAIKHIYPEKLNEGAGYSAIIFNHNLYIGTSNGLYTVPV
ncbi:MAG TPA: two-component regulator propeller domain-containing protein, partial [Chitinophaga sp.]